MRGGYAGANFGDFMTVDVRIKGRVAIVTISNPPVNAASADVRQGLMAALAQTEGDPNVQAVVLAAGGRTFVAGADVKEFGQPPVHPLLPDVVDAIERASKPWVAALHGTALGGGLELAMGCHARVADKTARMGLPEVNLGLIPGAGGTVRLSRLVAPETALTMIASGKPVSAARALEEGLTDATAEGDLLSVAIEYAKTLDGPRPTLERPLKKPADKKGYDKVADRFRAKARGQISVVAAVEAVERAVTQSPEQALVAERQAFLTLKDSAQSGALRHIFFAERKTLRDPRTKEAARTIDRIGVVGGGTMGAGIAVACLLAGFEVALTEQDEASALAAGKRVGAMIEDSARRGVIGSADAVMERFATSWDFSELGRADLVVEAVYENLDIKKEVFRRLDGATRPDAILATNTSYLDVNAIAAVLQDPSRAIGLHFFSPAHIMKLLEIVVPGGVDPSVIASAAALSKRLKKIGVLAGVCDGFIGNRIMSAYRHEADVLVLEGAEPSLVDAAMREYGFPIGIYQMQDLAGLDIAWAMRKRRLAEGTAGSNYIAIADRLCELGRFGRKTGAGWYDYGEHGPEPSAVVAKAIMAERSANGVTPKEFSNSAIMKRILGRMQSEAEQVLAEGVARDSADIDVVMVNGYGFPRWRGGPMYQREFEEAQLS